MKTHEKRQQHEKIKNKNLQNDKNKKINKITKN